MKRHILGVRRSLTVDEFRKWAGNTIFNISFVKRSTGEVRAMTARFRVRSALKGGKLPYDPEKHNLMTVYDLVGNPETGSKPGYKMVNLDQLIDLKIRGRYYVWDWRTRTFVLNSREVDDGVDHSAME